MVRQRREGSRSDNGGNALARTIAAKSSLRQQQQSPRPLSPPGERNLRSSQGRFVRRRPASVGHSPHQPIRSGGGSGVAPLPHSPRPSLVPRARPLQHLAGSRVAGAQVVPPRSPVRGAPSGTASLRARRSEALTVPRRSLRLRLARLGLGQRAPRRLINHLIPYRSTTEQKAVSLTTSYRENQSDILEQPYSAASAVPPPICNSRTAPAYETTLHASKGSEAGRPWTGSPAERTPSRVEVLESLAHLAVVDHRSLSDCRPPR